MDTKININQLKKLSSLVENELKEHEFNFSNDDLMNIEVSQNPVEKIVEASEVKNIIPVSNSYSTYLTKLKFNNNTLYFVLFLLVIGAGIWWMNRPKNNKHSRHSDDDDDA